MGAAWQAAHEEEINYAGLDYIAVWLGDNDWYNEFEKRMVEMCVNVHATPMIYAYVIAEFGKDQGLVDCDMVDEEHPNSLCSHGSEIIRKYFADSILTRYATYASGMREQLQIFLEQNPDTYETIWLIEPDFYQYSATGSAQRSRTDDGVEQLGGGIPDAQMGVYFSQIVATIKQYLPAAKIAIDISPWISDWTETSQAAWFANFDMNLVDYASTSGGGTAANNAKIRAGNKATWQELYEVTKRPILADAGYDKGGQGTGHAKIWDMIPNLNARIAEHVVGVMQMDAALNYPAMADTIRPQLKVNYPWCTEDGVYIPPEKTTAPVVQPVDPVVDNPVDTSVVAPTDSTLEIPATETPVTEPSIETPAGDSTSVEVPMDTIMVEPMVADTPAVDIAVAETPAE